MEVFSARLKWLRTNLGITQVRAAEIIGMSAPGYTKIENGQREPNLETLVKINKLVNESTDFLLGITDYSRNMKGMKDHFDDSSITFITLKSSLNMIENDPHDPNISTRDYNPDDPESVQKKISMLKKSIPLWERKFNEDKERLLSALEQVPMVNESTINELNNSTKRWLDLLMDNI